MAYRKGPDFLGWFKRWFLRRKVKALLSRWDEEGKMELLKAFFGGSKKATVVLVGILTVLLRDAVGLSDEMVGEIVKLVMAYIGGQGIVDVALVMRDRK